MEEKEFDDETSPVECFKALVLNRYRDANFKASDDFSVRQRCPLVQEHPPTSDVRVDLHKPITAPFLSNTHQGGSLPMRHP